MSDAASIKHIKLVRSLISKKERLIHRRERVSVRLSNLEKRIDSFNEFGYWNIGYFTSLLREIEEQIDDIDDMLRSVDML